MATIELVEGNTYPPLVATLSDAAGAKDLTGATVVARLTNESTGAVVEIACVIISEPNGTVRVPVPEAGWMGGQFKIEFDVTYVDGTTQTFPNAEEEIDRLVSREIIEAE